MTNTKLLEDLINKSGFKRSFIADKLGLSTYGLQLKIQGNNEFKPSEIEKLCELLKITSLNLKENIFFAK